MEFDLTPNYFYTSDHYRIFYLTNFDRESFNPDNFLLVFNYGLVCNIAHWKYQIPYFKELGFQVLLHDYRFHHSSSGNEENIELCTFDNITKDLSELLDDIYQGEQNRKVIMLGHSMGVNVSLEYAAQHPDLVSGMVLISGTVLPPQDVMFDSNVVDIVSPLIEILSEKFPSAYKALWTTSYLNPLFRKLIYYGGFNTSKVPEEFIQLYMKRIGELPFRVFLQLLQEMHDHNILNKLPQIQTPALVMGGDLDKVIPNYLQDILHRHLPNSELYIIKNGSHVPQADFPDSVNQRILKFIEVLEE